MFKFWKEESGAITVDLLALILAAALLGIYVMNAFSELQEEVPSEQSN